MMLKLKYFLLVTLYFQLFNVESAPLEPWLTIGPIVPPLAIDDLIGAGAGVGSLKINQASSGCWPKTIHEQQVLGEFH